MTQHLEHWLDAYLDGELEEKDGRRVEAHLQRCAACRSMLDQRRALGALLQAYPPAQDLAPAERFAASVRLQLPRKPLASPRSGAGLWLLVPLGLLFAWAFLQMVFVVAGLIRLIPGAQGALQPAVAVAQPGLVEWLASSLGQFWREAMRMAGIPGPAQWDTFGGLLLLVLVAFMYGLWMMIYAGVSTGAYKTE